MNNLNILYSVWIGGIEVNDFYLTKDKAIELYEEYEENGYTDICIEPIYTINANT